MSTAGVDDCNTCGGFGRWVSTFEEQPTELVDIGTCPDCVPADVHECEPVPAGVVFYRAQWVNEPRARCETCGIVLSLIHI